MTLVEWNADLATNHADIDAQHRALLEAFNHLQVAMDKGRGREEVRKTLMFLTNYTLQHFRMEEDLMDAQQYPEAQRHKKLHHDLVVRLAELMKAHMDHGPAALTGTTLDFLGGWLVEHIQGEDFRLAEFLRNKAT